MAVKLTPAGRAALAAGSPVALHVTAELATQPSAGSQSPRRLGVEFGWQQQPLCP